MIRTNPIRIEGAWRHGWALDAHTTASEFVGYDAQGREQFDTTRSELGELVYQLKYAGNMEAAHPIASVMEEFLQTRPGVIGRVEMLVPVPPSRARSFQPVTEIARRLAGLLGKPVEERAIEKTRPTEELKGLSDIEVRREALAGAFRGSARTVQGRSILLVDDLYRSGSTANAVTLALLGAGAERVYFLACTRTRSLT